MTFKSGFALLDVEAGRGALAKRVRKGERIPVVIRGTISDTWGNGDGASIEFVIDVASVQELKRPAPRK
jgi:hypothetical protein